MTASGGGRISPRGVAGGLAHFEDEEALLVEVGWSGIDDHIVHHRRLVKRGLALADDLRHGRAEASAQGLPDRV